MFFGVFDGTRLNGTNFTEVREFSGSSWNNVHSVNAE